MECKKTLAEEYQAYLQELRKKLAALPKGSKRWWKLNRELLQKKAKISSMPPLRDGTNWLDDAKMKADHLAATMAKKATLPPEAVDCPFFGYSDNDFDEFNALRSRYTKTLFNKLDETKATGPDKIPAAILKKIGIRLKYKLLYM